MIKGLVILSLMTLGQVDGSSLGAAADGLTDAVVADAASDAGNVAEETVAAEETAVAAEDEKKRDYSAIVGKNGKIDLLFLTDLNGQLADLKCGSEQGSTYANIIGAINSVRGNSLLIGAGNMNGRAPMARFIMDKGAAGAQELASLLALAKFDYILPGAEDFYVPAEQFKNYTAAWKENNLPVAISNLDVAADAAYGKELVAENGYTMLEQNGLKIAVIGLNSDDFIKGANRDNLKGITLKDYNEVAKKAATQAKDEGADFVIAVVKVDDSASAPAHAVGVASAAADVDVVLAAGYQTGKEAFAYRIEMNKAAAPVFAAPANAAGINKISIELKGTAEGWKIARADSNLIATADAAADSTVSAALDANVKAYCEEMTKPIGKGVIDGEMSADQFGNLLAQSARHATKSDVMIVDSNMVNADAFPIKGQISDDTLFA
ncbi:MAG: hypothetical protein MJ060_03415, partial [Clostridia bacterium]|nr:hypothetical protein [Clostridia bacterium]